MESKQTRIAPLSEMTEFKVSSDDPDPRGWDVVAADGRTVGTVKDLLVDRDAMRVRYVEVELADGARRTLLPIGTAQLDDETDRVLFHELSPEQLAELPAYDYATFTREYETSVVTRFGPGGGGATTSPWSYAAPHFDDDAFFRKRRNRYGGMARGESFDAPLTRAEENASALSEAEALVVGTQRTGQDRRANERREREAQQGVGTDGAHATPPRADANEIVVPIVEEELVVETRPVVKEELVIRKETVTEMKTVEADVRKERLDVKQSKRKGKSTDRESRDR